MQSMTEISIFKRKQYQNAEELQDAEWLFDKGTTKVCKADENSKKRWNRNMLYIKIALTNNVAIEIWRMFKEYFDRK